MIHKQFKTFLNQIREIERFIETSEISKSATQKLRRLVNNFTYIIRENKNREFVHWQVATIGSAGEVLFAYPTKNQKLFSLFEFRSEDWSNLYAEIIFEQDIVTISIRVNMRGQRREIYRREIF